MDFSIIRRAGLTQGEFGTLCGVSRVTANLWATGKMNPNKYIVDHVAAVIAAINKGLTGGKLPIKHNLTRDKRPAAVAAGVSLPVKRK